MGGSYLTGLALCALIAVVSALPLGEFKDGIALIDASPAADALVRKDDRSYGQIYSDAEDAMKRKYAGTPQEGKVTLPLDVETEERKAVKKVNKKDSSVRYAQMNAVVAHAGAIEMSGEVPLEHSGGPEEKNVAQTAKALEKADREDEALESTKALHDRFQKFSKEHGDTDKGTEPKSDDSRPLGSLMAEVADKAAAGQSPIGKFAELFAESQKLIANDKDFAAKDKKAHAQMMAAKKAELEVDEENPLKKKADQDEENNLDPQFKYDNDPTASIEASPSYQGVVKDEENDQKMEQEMKNQERQYQEIKKTGKVQPLPKVQLPKKMSKLDMANQFLASMKTEGDANEEFEKERAKYEAKYSADARTNFEDDKPRKITDPLVQAYYNQYKSKKSGDIATDVARFKKVQTELANRHVRAIAEAQKHAPTQETAAKLVQEGAAGALQLQKDIEAQTKIEKQKAESGSDTALEGEMKQRSLHEVQRWQAQTILQEGQDAVVQSAAKLEQTGAKGDLDVLSANVKRVAEGRPPLTEAEAKETTQLAETDSTLKHTMDDEQMTAYQKGVEAKTAEMHKDVQALKAGIDGESGVEVDMAYNGDDDELLPDSVNDPMFSKTVDTYGHSYNPHEYDPDADDDVELEPTEDDSATGSDSDDDLIKQTEQEEEHDQPEEALHTEAQEAEEGTVPTYQEKFRRNIDSVSPTPAKEAHEENEVIPKATDDAVVTEEPVTSGEKKPADQRLKSE